MSAGSAGSGGDRPLLQILDAVEFVAHHDNTAVVIRDGNVTIASGTDFNQPDPGAATQQASS